MIAVSAKAATVPGEVRSPVTQSGPPGIRPGFRATALPIKDARVKIF